MALQNKGHYKGQFYIEGFTGLLIMFGFALCYFGLGLAIFVPLFLISIHVLIVKKPFEFLGISFSESIVKYILICYLITVLISALWWPLFNSLDESGIFSNPSPPTLKTSIEWFSFYSTLGFFLTFGPVAFFVFLIAINLACLVRLFFKNKIFHINKNISLHAISIPLVSLLLVLLLFLLFITGHVFDKIKYDNFNQEFLNYVYIIMLVVVPILYLVILPLFNSFMVRNQK